MPVDAIPLWCLSAMTELDLKFLRKRSPLLPFYDTLRLPRMPSEMPTKLRQGLCDSTEFAQGLREKRVSAADPRHTTTSNGRAGRLMEKRFLTLKKYFPY